MTIETERPWERLDLKYLRMKIRNGFRRVYLALGRFAPYYSFSSIARRILFINVSGLIILVAGMLYLNQFRAGLIDAKVRSLVTQGQIIAGAIAASASIDTDRIVVDPEQLLELQSGSGVLGEGDNLDSLEFPINPERAAPILRRLTEPTGTRARIYDRSGALLTDSRSIYSRGQIIRLDLPPPGEQKENLFTRARLWFKRTLLHGNLPVYEDIGARNGKEYTEVALALSGSIERMARVNKKSELVLSVAVPIQRLRAVLGVLYLSTRGGEIDKIVAAERWGIVRVSLLALLVSIALSLVLASTIAGPMRKLSAAAQRVRRSVKARAEIPDFTDRSDEIGYLSGAFREMTSSLYQRIDAIERFAADVSHELKNPLTSLKSAVELLPVIKKKEDRDRLMGVILHDVKRLDRLITDISDASRLDAELAREDQSPVFIDDLLETVVPAFNDIHHSGTTRIELELAPSLANSSTYSISGYKDRLGQVINNLLDNAISFSPKDGVISVRARPVGGEIEIIIEDEGPGIPPDNLEQVFKRFYTDRPESDGFGNNSGLGLNISRQIIEAHGGRIWAENRLASTSSGTGQSGEHEALDVSETKVLGARFVIRLPAAVSNA